MSTSSNTASVRFLASSYAHSATDSPTRPGRVLPISTAILSIGCPPLGQLSDGEVSNRKPLGLRPNSRLRFPTEDVPEPLVVAANMAHAPIDGSKSRGERVACFLIVAFTRFRHGNHQSRTWPEDLSRFVVHDFNRAVIMSLTIFGQAFREQEITIDPCGRSRLRGNRHIHKLNGDSQVGSRGGR